MSEQLGLGLEPRDRRESKRSAYRRALAVYRETSREAWFSVNPHLSKIDSRIVWSCSRPGGATCDEIERHTGIAHQTVSAQVRHMTVAGLLADSGSRRATRSGRPAIVWGIGG